MSAAELIADPRFWSIERVHYGHNGECNTDGRFCEQMRIGARITVGAVTWYEGPTFAEALAKVERAFLSGPHAYVPSWHPPERSYLYVSCEVCGVDGHAHEARP